MPTYPFWFHDQDKNGHPLDENILRVAKEIAPLLTRYRKDELDCESTANEILQHAIEAASEASRKRAVSNPAGYLVSIYKRSVDKYLEDVQKVIPMDDQFLDDLANGTSASPEERMHNHLIVDKLLRLMDPDTRRICRWRLRGYSESEIAKRLGIRPNSVSVRFTRGFKEAAKCLVPRPTPEGETARDNSSRRFRQDG